MALTDLIAQLPEVYQPIFGHTELARFPSRSCEDRLSHILIAHDALQSLLDRPLQVLDLGCSQGYFSLSLARRGATVHGIDYLDKNIAVCKALARENPNFRVTFEVGRVEDTLTMVEPGQYDLVLGLSVFHHIVHERGVAAVRQMLKDLANKVSICIFELALASEPIYWASSQPDDPRSLLQDFAFVHELARYHTHLSDISRPLYVASSNFWCIDGVAGRIQFWKDSPHRLAGNVNQGSRRYYVGDNKLVRLYSLDHHLGDRARVNREEIEREIEFLTHSPQGISSPKLLMAGKNDREAWLVREFIPGEVLLEVIHGNRTYDASRVLRDVLFQVAALEQAGFYHNDVRVWNVLILSDGSATLMDYGSIVRQPMDCVWPDNIFLSFFIFAYEVITGQVGDPIPMRIPAISPNRFPSPYRNWVESFLSCPVSMWSFDLMLQLFNDSLVEGKTLLGSEPSVIAPWQQAIEDAINIHSVNYRFMANRLEQMEAKVQQAAAEASMANSLNRELQSVYASRSWRITRPLRAAHKMQLRLRAIFSSIPRNIKRRVGNLFSFVSSHSIYFVRSHPTLKALVLPWIRRYPALEAGLYKFAMARGIIADGTTAQISSVSSLTPSARCIYNDLKAAIDQHNRRCN